MLISIEWVWSSQERVNVAKAGHRWRVYFFIYPKYNGIRYKLLETVKEILAKCEWSKSLRLTILSPTARSRKWEWYIQVRAIDQIYGSDPRDIVVRFWLQPSISWTSSITVLLFHVGFWYGSRHYLDLKPFPTEYLQSVVKFINTKKLIYLSVDFQRNYVLSVKIYKCDFDSLGAIYLSAKNFALWYLVYENRMRSTTTTWMSMWFRYQCSVIRLFCTVLYCTVNYGHRQ